MQIYFIRVLLEGESTDTLTKAIKAGFGFSFVIDLENCFKKIDLEYLDALVLMWRHCSDYMVLVCLSFQPLDNIIYLPWSAASYADRPSLGP